MKINNGKAKPILFSTEMVQAILDGRKTMTRRIVKSDVGEQPSAEIVTDAEIAAYDKDGEMYPKLLKGISAEFDKGEWIVKCPYDIGDILWVRETFAIIANSFKYKADLEVIPKWADIKWRPSRFMPFEACRIFLEVKNIRVERLQDIKYDDILKEGWDVKNSLPITDNTAGEDAREWWRNLWVKINGQDSWDESPWVWVYEFERITI